MSLKSDEVIHTSVLILATELNYRVVALHLGMAGIVKPNGLERTEKKSIPSSLCHNLDGHTALEDLAYHSKGNPVKTAP